MKSKFLFIAAASFVISISNADAQVKHRSQHQKHRIVKGVKNGELTRAETKDLIADQKEIRQDVKLAKADSKISAAEKRIITKEQNQVSREIYRKKHNNRDRN
jgi:uncharacterized tellurite resistance protein B-like protein